METINSQQNKTFILPNNGNISKFDSTAFLRQVKKIRKLLSQEELEMLNPDDGSYKR